MAKSGGSRNGGENKDSNLANHSSVHSESESSIVGSLSSISPPRRQSPRLKGINDVYGSVDAHNSKLHQPSSNNNSFVTSQIKAEVLHEEGDLNDNCKRRCITRSSDLDSSSNTDDRSIISMTLKDFQARCKAKKRKSLKCNASMSTALTSQSSSDLSEEQDHSSEPPDEEPDINLPLISLKLKVMKKSTPPGRKRSRLCSLEHASRVGKINACTSSKIDICSKAEPSEGGEEDFVALTRKNFIDINNSIPPPVGQLKIDPEPLNVKNEILENGSWDACIALDVGKNSSLGTSNKCQEVYEAEFSEESIFSSNRCQELHANNFTGINGFDSSPNNLVQIELNDHAANPELTHSINSEILDAHNQEHESTLFVVNPANGDCIAKFSCPVNISVEVDGGHESDLQMEEINCSDNKISECCVNEASMVHMKHKYDCLANFSEDATCTESSEPVAASRLLPDTLANTNNNGFSLEDSIHGKNVNQLNDGSVNCYENKEIANYVSLKAMEDHGNIVCEDQAEELPVCSICTDGVIDNSGGSRESQNSFAHSVPSNKVKYLGNMVDEVLSTDSLTKHNKVHISCGSKDYSETGKHGLCSQKVDQFIDRNDSHFGENGGSTNDIYDCSPIKVIEDCGIVVDEEQAKELPICIINSDPTLDNSASFREFHDSGDTSPTDDSVESLDNIVDVVHRKEVPACCDKKHLFSHAVGHLGNGTYDLLSQRLNVCSGNDPISQIAYDRLHETELVSATSENTLNYHGSKISYDSTRVIDTKVVRIAADDHSPQCPTPCLGSFCLLRLTDGSTSVAEENIVPSTFHSETDAAAERPGCLPEIVPKDDSPKTEFNPDQSIGGLENTPEKLLSNRKTISPTSQEKLCQAVNGTDLYDALQSSKTRKKLWYENSAGNEIPSTLSASKETKSLSCSDKMTNKPNSRNESLPLAVKGILKSPDASNRTPCSCMESSLAKKQTQKAIEFSQQQMHDIEGVAMKLLKGLKSMKSIVQRHMLSEDSLPMTSNLTSDEIRAALDSASTVEGNTKRWLTIMARDCNRFCKIMKGDKKAPSPVNGVYKEGKKISFADEAGGLLCNVKVFE